MSDVFLRSIGGIPPRALTEEFGSPLYVYDLDVVRRFAAEAAEFGEQTRSVIHYAAKANASATILRTIRDRGLRIDCVSPGEIFAALRAGFSPSTISFTPNNAGDDDFRAAHAAGVHVTVDSIAQLMRYGRLFPGVACAVRVNPDVGGGHHKKVVTGGPDSKFGVDARELGEISVVAARTRTVIDGYHQHIGSGILDEDLLVESVKTALSLAPALGKDLRFIDFGGGWGIPYRPTDRTPDLNLRTLGERVRRSLDRFRDDWRLPIEFRFQPGRRIVARAGTLLATVTSVKRSAKHTFVGVDSGMNHLLRPALYDAYHDIRLAHEKDAPLERQTIVGNICESGDVLGRDRLLPRLAEGDVLAILDVGAYGRSMASSYNLRPEPAEVVVEDGGARLERRRRTIDELLA